MDLFLLHDFEAADLVFGDGLGLLDSGCAAPFQRAWSKDVRLARNASEAGAVHGSSP